MSDFIIKPPIASIILDRESVLELRNKQFNHFTGNLVLHYEEGHILSIEEEVLAAPKEET